MGGKPPDCDRKCSRCKKFCFQGIDISVNTWQCKECHWPTTVRHHQKHADHDKGIYDVAYLTVDEIRDDLEKSHGCKYCGRELRFDMSGGCRPSYDNRDPNCGHHFVYLSCRECNVVDRRHLTWDEWCVDLVKRRIWPPWYVPRRAVQVSDLVRGRIVKTVA